MRWYKLIAVQQVHITYYSGYGSIILFIHIILLIKKKKIKPAVVEGVTYFYYLRLSCCYMLGKGNLSLFFMMLC